jgi:hypothetical protein
VPNEDKRRFSQQGGKTSEVLSEGLNRNLIKVFSMANALAAKQKCSSGFMIVIALPARDCSGILF